MQECAKNKGDRTMEYIDKILKLTPQNDDEWEKKGFIYKIIEKPKKAIYCLKKAIELSPKEPTYYEKVGNLLSDLRQYTSALEYYKKTVEIFSLRKL